MQLIVALRYSNTLFRITIAAFQEYSLILSTQIMADSCYFCGRPAVDKEHVPPRCIFPEQKDAFGVDHRIELFKVPSCEEHNTKKSKEDEFLMMCLTPIVGNNGVSYVQTRTKLARVVERTNGRILNAVIRNTEELCLVTRNGQEFPVLIGTPDVPRLCAVLEHVARGIYFHHTGARFVGKVTILPAFIKYKKNSAAEIGKKIAGTLIRDFGGDWEFGGKNRDVFYYKIGPTNDQAMIPMIMTFFGAADVYVAFAREKAETQE